MLREGCTLKLRGIRVDLFPKKGPRFLKGLKECRGMLREGCTWKLLGFRVDLSRQPECGSKRVLKEFRGMLREGCTLKLLGIKVNLSPKWDYSSKRALRNSEACSGGVYANHLKLYLTCPRNGTSVREGFLGIPRHASGGVHVQITWN